MEINRLRKKLLYTYIYWPVGKVIVLTRILDQLMATWCCRLQHPMDKWIGRNILKVESQSESNNPKHWKAKHFIPFWRWELAPLPTFRTWFARFNFTSSCAPKVLNVEPAHTQSFIVFCNGVESGFMASAYEPSSLTVTWNSDGCMAQATMTVSGQVQWQCAQGSQGARSDPLAYALRPANCPAAACQQGSSHWQAPLPVRAASKLELPWPACHTCSQDQEIRVRALAIQVTRKARWALLGPHRISNTSRRKVTQPSRAETSVYSADQGEK